MNIWLKYYIMSLVHHFLLYAIFYRSWHILGSSVFIIYIIRLPQHHCVVCLFVCLLIFVPLENFSLICRRHHDRWMAANFDPFYWHLWSLKSEGSLTATPTVTWDIRLLWSSSRTRDTHNYLPRVWQLSTTVLNLINPWLLSMPIIASFVSWQPTFQHRSYFCLLAQRWRRRFERSPRKRKVGCLNPNRNRPSSLKQVLTAPLSSEMTIINRCLV